MTTIPDLLSKYRPLHLAASASYSSASYFVPVPEPGLSSRWTASHIRDAYASAVTSLLHGKNLVSHQASPDRYTDFESVAKGFDVPNDLAPISNGPLWREKTSYRARSILLQYRKHCELCSLSDSIAVPLWLSAGSLAIVAKAASVFSHDDPSIVRGRQAR